MCYRLAICVLIVITIQHHQHMFVAGEIFMEHGEDCRNLYNTVKDLEQKVSRMEEIESRVAELGRIIQQFVSMANRSATTDGSEMETNADFVSQNTAGTSLVKNKNKEKGVINSGRGIRRGVVSNHVAFTAYLDHPVTDLTSGMVIKFSGTLINDGNGYDIHTGIFTVPVDGTYLFTFSIVRINANQLVAKLVVDGVGMVDAIADPAVGAHEHQGTNAAIIRVRKGQTVSIKAVHMESGTLFSLASDRYCTFAGVLLY